MSATLHPDKMRRRDRAQIAEWLGLPAKGEVPGEHDGIVVITMAPIVINDDGTVTVEGVCTCQDHVGQTLEFDTAPKGKRPEWLGRVIEMGGGA